MGGDGGSIARRSELVRSKKKPEKVARDIKNAAKWKHCALTQEPLRPPIVTCPLGRLYNKESVIRALIDKTIGQIESCKHIISLKDVKELNLTQNPDWNKAQSDKGDSYQDPNISQFICPVTGSEMNGKYRFCVIWNCGCVISERAVKEMKMEQCPKCTKSFLADEVKILYGTDQEVQEYTERLLETREKQKLEKLTKKADKGQTQTATKRKALELQSEDHEIAKCSKLKPTAKEKAKTSKHELHLDKKPEKAIASSSTGSTSSVQQDNSKSGVFKSLFTSSSSGQNQPRAHWVTYNPLYY